MRVCIFPLFLPLGRAILIVVSFADFAALAGDVFTRFMKERSIMTDKAHGKKRGLLIGTGLTVVGLVAASCLFYRFVITADKTLSPSKDYQASFNRLSNTITVEQLSTGAKRHTAECYDPDFFWSPDSRYLAVNISYANGARRAEIKDLVHNNTSSTLTKSGIQDGFEDTRTHNQDDYACIEITKWLDNRYVIIEFSWPSDTPGENIAGWCVYDCTSRTVTELAAAK
ncbi:MAG: hypothetical protein LBL15_07175 [Oscillospiraceae bacterium]|nr:hypothetical protein [Oscillospiraceae bacterium]